MLSKATLGAGCFWCIEAMLKRLRGVSTVVPGYAGGRVPHPTYEQVCSHATGHAEVVQVEYDPAVLPYYDLLLVFFHSHDPTTLNRQGNDVGDQYRSVIFTHDDEQNKTAHQVIDKLTQEHEYDKPIATQVAPLVNFYPAEQYHMDYYDRVGAANGYCTAVISPKLKKFMQKYGSLCM